MSGAVHQDMLLLRWSISKIWKQNIQQFVIYIVWGWFSMFFFWERVHSQEQPTMKYLPRIEQQIFSFQDKNIENFSQKPWICYLSSSKRNQLKELQLNKLWHINSSKEYKMKLKFNLKLSKLIQLWIRHQYHNQHNMENVIPPF